MDLAEQQPATAGARCTYCIQTKQKCDGQAPCGICTRAHVECSLAVPTAGDFLKWFSLLPSAFSSNASGISGSGSPLTREINWISQQEPHVPKKYKPRSPGSKTAQAFSEEQQYQNARIYAQVTVFKQPTPLGDTPIKQA